MTPPPTPRHLPAQAEELEAARRREDQAKAETKATAKAEMAFANQQMLAAKSRQREAEAREEARLVALMMAKFAKDEADERAVASSLPYSELHERHA